MGRESHVHSAGNDPAHPTDGGDQLGDRVLGGHGIIQQCRIERSAGLSLQHPGGIDDRAHGIEDPLGTFGLSQPGAPVGEDREVEPLVVEGQPTGHLPADPVPKGPGRVPIGESFEGLEDHDRGHHVGGDGRSTTTRREQVLEHLVGEQIMAVISQERLDTSVWDKLATQCRSVEQLRVGFASSLHPSILDHPGSNREHRSENCSTLS